MRATAVTATGDFILVGSFTGTAGFGTTTLTSAGQQNGFVAKWSVASGSYVWAYRMGGSRNDEASAVVVSGANIYVGGTFNSPVASFNNLSLANSSTDCLQYNPSDLFVAKLTDAGPSAGFVWAIRPVGRYAERFINLAVNGTNVYLTGYMESSVTPNGPGGNNCTAYNQMTFGTSVINVVSPDQTGFVAKLTDNGSTAGFAWAVALSCSSRNGINKLVVDNGSVYLAGYFEGTKMYLGSDAARVELLVNTTRYYPYKKDGFIVKLNDLGSSYSLDWAIGIGGPGDEAIRQVAISGSDVYLAGTFSDAANIGSTTFSTTAPTGVFIAKLLTGGTSRTFAWAQQVEGVSGDVALAARGTNLYLAGTFTGATINFGGTVLTNSAGTSMLYVAKLLDTNSRAYSWAKGVSNTTNTSLETLALNGNHVYVVGEATSGTAFDNLTLAGPAATRVYFQAGLLDPLLTGTASPALRPEIISLTPNPAHGRATVQLPPIPGTATAILTLLDALGRTLRTQPAATNAKTELDLIGLSPGLYAVRVQAGGSTATRRLMVE